MGGYVFDHGADRKLPLSRRTAALCFVVLALAVTALVAGRGSEVEAARSRTNPVEGAPSPRALVDAAATGNGELVGSLLARGVDPNERDRDGKSALSAAIRADEVGVVRRLLAAGARLSKQDRVNRSDLHLAAVHDDAELIGLILEAGAAVDERAKDQDDGTALHIACENGRAHAVDALIHAGADTVAKDARGFTPLARAALLSRTAIVELLVVHGIDVRIKDARGRCALQLASAVGDVDAVRLLLEAGADASLADDHGWTALHEAAAHGRTDVVQALLGVIDRQALSARTSRGATALYLAARRGESNCVRALLDAGADPSIRDADGRLASDLAPPGVFDEAWTRLGPASPRPAMRRPDPVLLDSRDRRPKICVCSRPARTLRGPVALLDLAIWEDGATVFAPWSAYGSREYVAGVMSPSAVKSVLLDLEEIDWLDEQAPPVDPELKDCVELMLEHRGVWTRRIWDEVERLESDAAPFNSAALADWTLGRSRARDVLRSALPRTTQAISFVLVRGSFRGLKFQGGAHASWMD